MKNSEWGATVYLTHSKYGRNKSEVSTNPTLYTGGGQNLNEIYETNAEQSSTGNATGIYDLSGNSAEYVAGYNKAYYDRQGSFFGGVRGNTSTEYRPADRSKSHFAYKLDGASDKYVTAYSNSTSTIDGDFTVRRRFTLGRWSTRGVGER